MKENSGPNTAGIVQGVLILGAFALTIVTVIVVGLVLLLGGYHFDMIYIYR